MEENCLFGILLNGEHAFSPASLKQFVRVIGSSRQCFLCFLLFYFKVLIPIPKVKIGQVLGYGLITAAKAKRSHPVLE